MDAIAAFADHVVQTRFEDLPTNAVDAAKIFILDTLGVGVAGSSGSMAHELAQLQETWGRAEEARVWGNRKRLSAAAAAMCNAYQVHNAEFDCVHEEAVVHAMTVVLPVAMAGAERSKGINGRDLIAAVVLGVDVAAGLGVAASAGLRFFRPATAGAFGGTATLGKLMGFDRPALINAFSIAYAQVCGTMQAHTEGSGLLALQMGFNARNAVIACDLAARGFDAPKNVLEGTFGYFKLIESTGDPARVARDLGRRWFVTELAHKPYPSGRATHGIIEACLSLRRQHGCEAAAIDRVTARVPPLVHHLVGRPPHDQMSVSYARLCARYLAARALLKGSIGFDDFSPDAYGDAETRGLAQRVAIEVGDAGDPNALTPIEVEIRQRDGRCMTVGLDVVYGNPRKRLGRDDHLAKFRRNLELAPHSARAGTAECLIEQIDGLEDLADVSEVADLLGA